MSKLTDRLAGYTQRPLERDPLAECLSDCLPVVYGGWCDALLDTSARDALAAVAGQLPAAFLLHQLGFECDLGSQHAHADLLVAARQSQNGALLLEHTADQALNRHNNQHPVWASVKQLAVMWQSPRWSAYMDDFWLEFDVSSNNPYTPNLFIDPGIAISDRHIWDAWWGQVGGLLLGQEPPGRRHPGKTLDTQHVKDFYHCLQSLPPSAHIFQIGVMRARSTTEQTDAAGAEPPSVAGFRLCISHLYLDAILDFLPKIGIHQGRRLRESFIALQTLADGFTVHVDIPFDAQPRLGLECYLGEQPAHAALRLRNRMETTQGTSNLEARWDKLLGFLQLQGLCQPEKRLALRQYPATMTAASQAGRWPAGLLALQQRMPRQTALHRWIHHIKLDFVDGLPVKAKAYLSVGHTWV